MQISLATIAYTKGATHVSLFLPMVNTDFFWPKGGMVQCPPLNAPLAEHEEPEEYGRISEVQCRRNLHSLQRDLMAQRLARRAEDREVPGSSPTHD